MTDYLIQPRDPLMFRDGRPFSADPGSLAESMRLPYPSTLAGALRTLAGNATGRVWDKELAAGVHSLKAKGPLPIVDDGSGWKVYLPAPADAVILAETDDAPVRLMRLRPWKIPSGTGCNAAPYRTKEGNGKQAAFGSGCGQILPLKVTDDGKPQGDCDLWSLEDCVAWLADPESTALPGRMFGHAPVEDRTHVDVDKDFLTGKNGMLFSTVSVTHNDWTHTRPRRDKPEEMETSPARALLIRVEGWDDLPDETFVTAGGERRLSRLSSNAETEWPEFPDRLRDSAKNGIRHLKLQLVTPAPFAHGWKPGWVDPGNLKTNPLRNEEGHPPLPIPSRMRLVAACVPRRQAVSGWSNFLETTQEPGPKRARYLAPAGSVYFFEVDDGDEPLTEKELEELWLASICDSPHDRGDGFGLVVPGVWDYAEED